MPFLTKGKTNWGYVLIVVVFTTIVSCSILAYYKFFEKEIILLSQPFKTNQSFMMKKKKLENEVMEKIMEKGKNGEINCLKITKENFDLILDLTKSSAESSDLFSLLIEKNLAYSLFTEKEIIKEYKIGKGKIQVLKEGEYSPYRSKIIVFLNEEIAKNFRFPKTFFQKIDKIKKFFYTYYTYAAGGISLYKKDENRGIVVIYPDTYLYGYSDHYLWCFSFQNNKYIVINTHVGVNKTSDDFIFFVSPSGELKLIKEPEGGESAIYPNSFVLKDNRLYIRHEIYPIYTFGKEREMILTYDKALIGREIYPLLVKGDELKLDYSGFKEEILKEAEENALKCMEKGNLVLLAVAVSHYLFAGEKEKAIKLAEEFFAKFPEPKTMWGDSVMEHFKTPITLEDFKKYFDL
jgi:hypothetical protein